MLIRFLWLVQLAFHFYRIVEAFYGLFGQHNNFRWKTDEFEISIPQMIWYQLTNLEEIEGSVGLRGNRT